jgi:hypothetical protein
MLDEYDFDRRFKREDRIFSGIFTAAIVITIATFIAYAYVFSRAIDVVHTAATTKTPAEFAHGLGKLIGQVQKGIDEGKKQP